MCAFDVPDNGYPPMENVFAAGFDAEAIDSDDNVYTFEGYIKWSVSFRTNGRG